jgi:hypothetical protein
MSLLVEDGSIIPGAESYVSVIYADTYHLLHGNSDWALLSNDQKEQSLRNGTEAVTQLYSFLWKGFRVNDTQSLDWPRTKVYLNRLQYQNTELSNTLIPDDLKKVVCILSLKSRTEDLVPDLESKVIMETVGPITTKYSEASPTRKQFTAISLILKPYLNSGGSKVIRG